MKKYSLLILFANVFSTSNAQTSVYHPFPDSNAVWNVAYSTPFSCAPKPSYVFSYTFSGDTNIIGKTYHKLILPYWQSLADTCSTSYTPQISYAGCISQDTAAKKVFFIYPNDTTQQILYDFSLNVGDTYTLPNELGTCWSGKDSIINIDSILIGIDYRKRWNVYYGMASYIEGIGFTSGLLQPCVGATDGPYYGLACFSQEGVTLYHPDTAILCNIIASVDELSEADNTILVYPNPTAGAFTISINKNMNEGKVNVFNMMGEEVFTEPFRDKQKTINLKLPSGIYFVQVTNGFETRVCRFIK